MTEMMLQEILKNLVEEADLAAVANVRAGRGGPFGASLNLINLTTLDVQRIGAVAGNAVLETGIGSAHAEDQALNADHISALRTALAQTGPAQACVVVASSGESCPACHAKIEILARILLDQQLILPERFIVAYGASYADTLAVAGFNDAPYHADFNQPAEQRLIACENCALAELTPALQQALAQGHAVVEKGHSLYHGSDQRPVHFTLTPEVSALRAAALAQKQQGHDSPWDLQRATLYTAAPQIGPLTYAEAQWANIARIVCVKDAPARAAEAPGVSNDALFRAIATRPYNNPHSVLRVIRINPFANQGQHEWAKLQQSNPDLINYNGVPVTAEEIYE